MDEISAMRLAIQEAYKGSGFVSPNPLVGCVILDSENNFLAKGYHEVFGGPHAEVNALQGLREQDLKNATVFVTLEPCAHEGKTPSCAKALAKLPIAKVVYGMIDPNPLVAGQGVKILEASGIKVQAFEHLHDELEEVSEHFLWNQREKKPFVSLKVASSLDGFMGLQSGESKWITSETARDYSHFLRASHDAVLVGRGTLLTDNPKLNIRNSKIKKKNKVVILDSNGIALSKRKELEIFNFHDPQDIYFAVADKHKDLMNPAGAQILSVPTDKNGLNLKAVLQALWSQGIKSVFVEGGSQVLSSFISENLGQRLYLFQAPILLGAKAGRSWTDQVKIDSMNEKISLKNMRFTALGSDVLLSGRF